MQKKRILFVGEGVTLAHIVRPLVLAKALDKEIYDVFFACDARFKKMVDNEGFNWQEISTMPSEEFLKKLSTGDPLYTYERLKSNVADDLDLLSRIRPDLVIGDFRISLDISAPTLNIPYVCLVNVYWSPYSTLILPIPELPKVNIVYLTIAKLVFKLFSSVFLASHMQGFNRLRSEYRLPPINNIKKMYTDGTWTLYLDLPSLVPVYSLPANHQYLGPVCEMLSLPKPEWWGKWPNHKPIIYLSFGSSGDITLLDLFKSILKEMDVTVILTTSGRVKEEDFPENFYVTQYVDGLEVARIAQLFISNGGSGAIYQALTHGVPVLGLPSNMDQFFLMERIEKLGAGILIRPSQATKSIIVSSIEHILLEKRFKDVAGGIGAHIRKFDTKAHFKDFVAGVLKNKRNV